MKKVLKDKVIRSHMQVVKELGTASGLNRGSYGQSVRIQIGSELLTLVPASDADNLEDKRVIYALREVTPYQRSDNWRLFEVKLEARLLYYTDAAGKEHSIIHHYYPYSWTMKRVYYVSQRRKV